MKDLVMFFLFVCVMFVLFGCGADEEVAFEISDKAPSVSIKKIGYEIKGIYLTLKCKVVSDATPKTDLLVNVAVEGEEHNNKVLGDPCHRYSQDGHWATIPEGKKESQEIHFVKGTTALNGYAGVKVLPLPTIDIVGEGEVIDQEQLQSYYGGNKTTEDKQIPEDFVFPYYEVADPELVIIYRPKAAKIISIDPPQGSLVNYGSSIHITFDTPPECPHVSQMFKGTNLYGDGKKFTVRTGYDQWVNFGVVRPIKFTVSWGKSGTERSESFEYFITR